MTLTEKIIEEFKGTKFAKEGGSCFECCDYEGMYVELKSFILHFASQIATEAIEAVKVDKKLEKTLIHTSNYPRVLMEEAGFNSAILEMEQKAKKFFENL